MIRAAALSAALLLSPIAVLAQAAAPVQAAINENVIRAQLLPKQYTTLAAEIGAKIQRLPLREGARFRAGEELVAFDCSVQDAMLRKARAEETAAAATQRANARLAELNSIGAVELELSAAAVERTRADVGAQQALLDKCRIRAPFAGRIAEQKVRAQQFVQPGTPLLDILDDSVLELEFLLPSRWLAQVKVGGALDVEIDETGRHYPARFIRIGARIDPVSQSVKVAAAINGQFPELIAGMSGRVRLGSP